MQHDSILELNLFYGFKSFFLCYQYLLEFLSYVLCYRHIARVIKTHHLSKDQVETLQRVLKTYEKQLSGDYMLNIADICAEHSKKQLYVIFENCEVIA